MNETTRQLNAQLRALDPEGYAASDRYSAKRASDITAANEEGYEQGITGGARDNPFAGRSAVLYAQEFMAWDAGYLQGDQVRRDIANGA